MGVEEKILYFDSKPHRHKRNGGFIKGFDVYILDPGSSCRVAMEYIERENFLLYIVNSKADGIPELINTIVLTSAENGGAPFVYLIGSSPEQIKNYRELFADFGLNPDKVSALPSSPNGYMEPQHIEEAHKILKKELPLNQTTQ